MKLAALQLPQFWNDRAGVFDRLRRALERLEGVDLALLPEAAFTGYVSPSGDYDLSPFAEPLDGPTARAVAALAVEFGLALGAPLIERDGGRCFNALLLVDAGGRRVGHWRKRHPWIPERWATPGDRGTEVVEWRGLRVAGAICYDLHFLEEAREELSRADLLLFPTAWVEEGADTRVPLLRALARRHGLSVVNANWGRGEPAVPGQGGSVILGPDGAVLARVEGTGEGAAVA